MPRRRLIRWIGRDDREGRTSVVRRLKCDPRIEITAIGKTPNPQFISKSLSIPISASDLPAEITFVCGDRTVFRAPIGAIADRRRGQ